MEKVNTRVHAVTLEISADMLATVERAALHRGPFALTLCHGRVGPTEYADGGL